MTRGLCVAVFALCGLAGARAQLYPNFPSETPSTFKAPTAGMDYERREVMIEMRDRVKLHTVILWFRRARKTWGVLLTRTPYSASQLTTNGLSVHLGATLWGYDNATEAIIGGAFIRVVREYSGKVWHEGDCLR